jgi:two-component system, NtrC family, sensor kinase
MYPELQSALLAETSAPLILLGGAVLLYRSFREKYLLPWIAGWALYALAKFLLAISMARPGIMWPALVNVVFVLVVQLFSTSIFYYVYRPALVVRTTFFMLAAMLLGILPAFWPEHENVIGFFFQVCWRIVPWTAAWLLFRFSRGRGNIGSWVLCFSLLVLFQHHPTPAYGILDDVMLGISMMMIVLDESRLQNTRLDFLNRLSRVVSGPDGFRSMVDATLAEMMKISGARAAWLRVLEDDKLRVAGYRGFAEGSCDSVSELDNSGTAGLQLLTHGEVGVISLSNMPPAERNLALEHGIQHIVAVPVIGKTTRMGVLSLGMRRDRFYTDHDRNFLKAAANQLGLAAENGRLVQQLMRSVQDLTETRATEERYKTLFDHMQEGIFVCSPEGHILDCNEAFVHMIGFSDKEELVSLEATEFLYANAEDRQKFVAEMEKHGFVRNFEFALKRRDGRHIHVIESSFASRAADGSVRYQGVLLDITEKIKLYDETRKAYDDLRRTQEQLLQSEKMSAVGRMISGVAHELNNPLTAISGYTQLLEAETADARVQEFIAKLHKQTNRAHRIVQNLLSFSRQHKPHRIHVDLRKVMEETIALRDFELKSSGISLERDFEPVLPDVVADPHQLEQVFLNIINNAVDAILETGRGGVLRIRIFAEEFQVVGEFHDSGLGMTDPKHVFDPFYTTKSVGKGTGLGLSICYGIVKEHGGEIMAYNHAEGGAVVQVRLPEAIGVKPISEGDLIVARRESNMQGRVLLVDAADVLDYEREVLSAAGLEVVAHQPTVKVFESLLQTEFDIVLLDTAVSGPLESANLVRWMREERPDVISRVVLMMPPTGDGAPRSFINPEGLHCFVKPFEASALFAVLRRFLRARTVQGDTMRIV